MIAHEQSAHRSARNKISVQWWFRILKDRHSPRYDNKLIPRRPTVWRTTATSVDLGTTMPVGLFIVRNLKTVSGLAFCLAMLPAMSHPFTQADQRPLSTAQFLPLWSSA